MKIILLILSILCYTAVSAQLVPYQVQDFHHWDQAKLWGYKDESFKIVIAPVNEQPSLFYHGYAVLKKNNRFGLIDSKGKIIISPTYGYCSNAEGDYVTVKDAGEMNTSTYVISLKTKEQFGYTQSLYGTSTEATPSAGVLIDVHFTYNSPSTYGLVTEKRETIIPSVYASVNKFYDGMPATEFLGNSLGATPSAFIMEDGVRHLYGIAGSDGKWIFQPKYSSIGFLHNGLARVSLNNKYGFIDFSGREVIPVQYDDAKEFSDDYSNFLNNEESYTSVKQGGESFFIDTKGHAIFKGKGLHEAIFENNALFIIRDRNDSVYIVDKDLHALTRTGANDIVTTDGKNFLARIGNKAFALNNATMEEFPVPNVAGISAFSVSLYNLVAKNAAGKYTYTIMGDNFKPIINQSDIFTFQVNEGLNRLGIYFHNAQTDSDVLLTYVDNTGKEYSDISR